MLAVLILIAFANAAAILGVVCAISRSSSIASLAFRESSN
jgi:hypothetical protein